MNKNIENAESKKQLRWLLTCAICLIAGLASFAALIIFNKEIKNAGMTENLYFIVLVPIAFAASAFLFGALKSYAKYVHTTPDAKLTLAGPVVLFFLLIFVGFKIPDTFKKKKFDIRFRLVNRNGDRIKINNGVLVCYLEKESRIDTSRNGEYHFQNIPISLNNSIIRINFEHPDFRLSRRNTLIDDREEVFDLELDSVIHKFRTTVRGSVTEDGYTAAAVLMSFGNARDTCTTDHNGLFEIELPVPEGRSIALRIFRERRLVYDTRIVASADAPIDININ